MWSLEFWRAVAERGIKTLAQTAAAILVGDGVGLLEIDWCHVASVAVLAAIASVLTSIASGIVTGGQTSLTRAETLVDAARRNRYLHSSESDEKRS